MKKILFLSLFTLLLFISCKSQADVVTTQRKINRQPQTVATPQKQNYYQHKSTTPKKSKLETSISSCKPYSENLSASYMGMDMNYKVSIEGWINNKCRLNFAANISGTNSSFANLYGVDPSTATILSFAPKIQCNFTKQQLEYVGDSILQEQERNHGATNNMLKNPNEISMATFTNINDSDKRLLEVILSDNACTILNTNDLNNLMQNLMQF